MTTKPFIVPAGDKLKIRKFLLTCLQYGRRNAIRGKELAKIFGSEDDRHIRVMIDELIEEGMPIAAAVSELKGGGGVGFFICETDEEVAAYIQVLKNRERETMLRRLAFEKASANFSPPEQGSLL